MTPSASQEALRTYLKGQGTDPEMIERHVARMDGGAVAPLVLAPPLVPVSRGTIVLPWSCLASDNGRHTRFASHSAAYKLARTRAREEATTQWPGAPIVGAVRVTIVVTPPNHQRRDIVNFCKALLDSLTGVAYADDSQIAELTIRRGAIDVDRPNATITVESIDA